MSGQFRGDFTRDTFAPFKHFAGVLMQQGRVQLDADWSEQAAILLHYIRTFTKDLVGPYGASGNGFLLGVVQDASGAPQADFSILHGSFYADGILCELDTSSVPIVLGQLGTNQVLLPTAQLESIDLGSARYLSVYEADKPAPLPVIPIPSTFDGKTLSIPTAVLLLPSNPTNLSLSLATTYLTQPDLPRTSSDDLKGGPFLAYLDVWERHIAALEDDSLLEVASEGPDTACRAKVVSQVKLTSKAPSGQGKIPAFTSPGDAKKWLTGVWPIWPAVWQPPNRGWLLARTSPQPLANTNPCVISPRAQYPGAENQLYRVEVHSGSVDATGNAITPTFKWSRENGSVIYKVSKVTVNAGKASPTTHVQLASLGRDARFGLQVGDWVEFVNDDYTLLNWAFPLLQVQSVNVPTRTVTLAGAIDSRLIPGATKPPKHPLLRRWDHQQVDPATTNVQWSSVDNAVKIVEASRTPPVPWIDLEDGIQIQFQPAPGGPRTVNTYRTGDYWLIPARTANGGEVEWPTDAAGNALSRPPHGVTHHYAPLAIVVSDANGMVSTAPVDLRPVIAPAAK